MRVLDLGGWISSWTVAAPVAPAQVVILNIEDPPESRAHVKVITGDACDPPAELRMERFDLVFSNSVIEHVGGHARRLQFVETVNHFSDCHWVQTPYRYFPLEPHWVFPGMQFLPLSARSTISARWPLGFARHMEPLPEGKAAHVRLTAEIELLSRTEMEHYFPESSVIAERFVGLTKSLIALKGERSRR
jgi:hypothetical protein